MYKFLVLFEEEKKVSTKHSFAYVLLELLMRCSRSDACSSMCRFANIQKTMCSVLFIAECILALHSLSMWQTSKQRNTTDWNTSQSNTEVVLFTFLRSAAIYCFFLCCFHGNW